MGRTLRTRLACVVAAASLAGSAVLLRGEEGANAQKQRPFDQRLESRAGLFDTAGRPFVRAVLDLVFEHQLPLGLEYIDSEALRRPLRLKLSDKSVREILQALVGQLPEYRLKVSSGVLQIYSPKARTDTSNLLNAVIDNLEVTAQSPRMASVGVYAALMANLHQPCCEVGNVLDSGHPRTLTLHLRNMKVYELLDALVADNGESLWVAAAPPAKLSKTGAKLWEVYALGPGWEKTVLSDIQRLFPPEK